MSAGNEIFIPGRLCILGSKLFILEISLLNSCYCCSKLGEHTDWAGEYKHLNASIPNGFTIVCATNEGLYARTKSFDKFMLQYVHKVDGLTKTFETILDIDELHHIAKQGGFYCYIAGTAAAILETKQFIKKYPNFERELERFTSGIYLSLINGLSINNYLSTLPMKKGLSSSAAVCVLVATAFNRHFNLGLSSSEIMEVAYNGEMKTPSRCGRMDQCVVMGTNAIALMEFENTTVSLRRLYSAASLYFVVVDLKVSKDTVTILRDLNKCFPKPTNPNQELMHEYCITNVTTSQAAVTAIETGDVNALAECMRTAQDTFDKCVAVNCPSQLTSPVLHRVMNDLFLKSLSLAIKGVGSQGDGSAQLLCSTPEQQYEILDYVRNTLNMDGFALTITPTPIPATTESEDEVANTGTADATGATVSSVVDFVTPAKVPPPTTFETFTGEIKPMDLFNNNSDDDVNGTETVFNNVNIAADK